jgi:hypothetical protein
MNEIRPRGKKLLATHLDSAANSVVFFVRLLPQVGYILQTEEIHFLAAQAS